MCLCTYVVKKREQSETANCSLISCIRYSNQINKSYVLYVSMWLKNESRAKQQIVA